MKRYVLVSLVESIVAVINCIMGSPFVRYERLKIGLINFNDPQYKYKII